MTDRVYRVRQLIRKVEFLLLSHYHNIEVEGEISSWKESARGHCYFSLKEDPDILPCVLFKRYSRRTRTSFQTGDMVLARGNLTVYGPRGNYQLIVQDIRKTGEGEFYREFLRIKARLEKEGLFNEENKQALPPYPARIGVITSKRGAAIRDIINIIRRRNPYAHIIIRPAVVQGEEAVPDLVQALKDFAAYGDLDIVILGRGGGSLEDLWAFNEEKVARALFEFPIPVISAVGHQSDIVITDLVADYRAETPSAAAEKVTENHVTLFRNLQQYSKRLDHLIHLRYQAVASTFLRLHKHPYLQQPQLFINKKQQLLDDYRQLLNRGLQQMEKQSRRKLDYLNQHLKVLSPVLMVSRRKEQLQDYQQRMNFSFQQAFLRKNREFIYLTRRLHRCHPQSLMIHHKKLPSHHRARLIQAMKRQVDNKQTQLSHLAQLLETTNPFNLLKKGYTIVYDKKGFPVKRGADTTKNQPVDIRFYDGKKSARIEDEE